MQWSEDALESESGMICLLQSGLAGVFPSHPILPSLAKVGQNNLHRAATCFRGGWL